MKQNRLSFPKHCKFFYWPYSCTQSATRRILPAGHETALTRVTRGCLETNPNPPRVSINLTSPEKFRFVPLIKFSRSTCDLTPPTSMPAIGATDARGGRGGGVPRWFRSASP